MCTRAREEDGRPAIAAKAMGTVMASKPVAILSPRHLPTESWSAPFAPPPNDALIVLKIAAFHFSLSPFAHSFF